MDTTGTVFLPPPDSTIAPEVDALFNFIVGASIIFFLIVVVGALYFVYRYKRRGRKDYTPDISENMRLEILWTVIPTILVIIVFFWGFRTYLKMHVSPFESLSIKATGQKWFWQFDYDNGASSTNDLVVPVGQPVELLLSSQDVVHSFFVPNFRVKMDVLPNRYTKVWFEATREGEFDLYCTEFCGTGHSKMVGKVKVLSEQAFNEWLEESGSMGEGLTLEEFGSKLYESKACITCHSIDGAPNTGPTFQNLYGRLERTGSGEEYVADENYIRESILQPQSKIVEGYQPVMPTYQGILKEREIDALIAYIKTLKQ